ncbi:MAG: sigma 54-interacting transcriptional regulator [Nannocystales bacterium]
MALKPQPSGAMRVPVVTQHHESPFDRVETLATGVRLLVEEGPDVGAEFVLNGLVVSGGRGAGQDVRLIDPLVSEAHFELRVSEQGLALRDLGSRNGTWVGRARLLGAVELREGASFFVGESRVRVMAIEQGNVSVARGDSLCGMYGRSVAMRRLFALLRKLAPTDLEVLIEGETGVGKEGAARALHDLSGRKGRFLALNCGAVPRELAEGVLFGHKKGAFTGASESAGAFESADGGTLFLDEIGELPIDLQPKLLRLIDQQEVARIGEHEARKVEVRVVCATHQNLGRMVSEGRFREDLFYRIATMRIEVPALRDRRDDIAGLASLFLRSHAEGNGRKLMLSEDAVDELEQLEWPGNIRQLKAVVRRAAYLVDGDEITASALRGLGDREVGARDGVSGGLLPLRCATDGFQREYCENLLRFTEGNLEKAVEIADYSKRGFLELLKRLGVAR